MSESKSISVGNCLIITAIDREGFDVLQGSPGRLIGWRSTEERAIILALETQLEQANPKFAEQQRIRRQFESMPAISQQIDPPEPKDEGPANWNDVAGVDSRAIEFITRSYTSSSPAPDGAGV